GRPATGDGPGLAPLDCAADSSPFMLQGFPEADDGAALICLLDDPWAVASQRVDATFDGPIPRGSGGDGRIVIEGADVWLVAPAAAFCAAGVLGTEDVLASALGATDPEVGYLGDQVEIISDLSASAEELEQCEVFDIPDDGTLNDRDPIRFQVLEARPDRLRLAELDVSLAAVLECFPRAFSYRVRARGAYVVTASVEGVAHRVVSDAGAGGACRVDTAGFPVVPGDAKTYANFRAFAGRTFISPSFAFHITGAGPEQDLALGIDDRSTLLFDVRRYPTKLGIDVSTTALTGRQS